MRDHRGRLDSGGSYSRNHSCPAMGINWLRLTASGIDDPIRHLLRSVFAARRSNAFGRVLFRPDKFGGRTQNATRFVFPGTLKAGDTSSPWRRHSMNELAVTDGPLPESPSVVRENARIEKAVIRYWPQGIIVALVVLLWVPRLTGPIDLRWDAAVYYVLGTSIATRT